MHPDWSDWLNRLEADYRHIEAPDGVLKALYELRYELNSRPDWVNVPLQGILDLVEAAQGGVAGPP